MGLLNDLLGAGAAQAATSNNTSPQIGGWQQWQQAQPGQTIPVTIPPGGQFVYPMPMPQPRPTLSDFDIELMAVCIANQHPVVDGQSHCFCMLKRLERGISKD